jgi:preprotein translocase subunit SecF
MDFLRYRFVFLALSLIIIVVGLIYGFNSGFRFDIDFMGGTKIQVDLKQEFLNNEIEDLVSKITSNKPLVQKMSSGTSTVSITTNVITEDMTNQITSKLKEKYVNMDEPSIRNVQPAFGNELIQSTIVALVVSVTIILLYILIRFKTLGGLASITAVIALIHDALIMVAIYGIFKFPINSTFVAVLLTVMGYSINDTIIIYDRIRENKRKIVKSNNLKDTINDSLNQVMKRTLYTSFTTVAAIAIVFIFAYMNNQEVLKEFSLPLIVGIITGTYSSIFVASSLWYISEEIRNKIKKKV